MSLTHLADSSVGMTPATSLVRVNRKVLEVAREAAAQKMWWLGVPLVGEWVPPPPPPANVIYVIQHPHSDLAMGLAEFTEGAAIKGEDVCDAGWIAVHLSICAGRQPIIDDCIDWTYEHEDRWRKIVADPLASECWQNAPKPWQLLAAIFEWVAYLDASSGFVSHIPVSLDASLMPEKEVSPREVIIDEHRANMLAAAAVGAIKDGGTVIGVSPGVFATHGRDAHNLEWWMNEAMDLADKEAAEATDRNGAAAVTPPG